MEDGDSENCLYGGANRKLIFNSQLSQNVDFSQRYGTNANDTSIEKSLDVHILTQSDFCTPGFTQEIPSQVIESVRDSVDNSFVFGETPQKHRQTDSRTIFKRKAGFDVSQSDMKRQRLFPSQQQTQSLTASFLPKPEPNPYLVLPKEIEQHMTLLLKEKDFNVLNIDKISRYQNDFRQLDILGKGISSTVMLCQHRIDGCFYAIKQISLTDSTGRQSSVFKRVKKEVKLLSTMSEAPNIIRYFTSWKEDDYFYIQLEYGFYGNIQKYAIDHTLSEEVVKILLYQIGCALSWLHNRGFAHLDVKPENILITRKADETTKTSWLFKLTDFGLSCHIHDDTINDGDGRYLPPEIVTASTAMKADVFSLGASALELLSNTHARDFYATIREGKIPKECHVSPYLRIVLLNMIQTNVSMRWSIDQVIQHPFIKNSTTV